MFCLLASLLGRRRNFLGGLLLVAITSAYFIWTTAYLENGDLIRSMLYFGPFAISGILFGLNWWLIEKRGSK
jgi:hypothetical protein